jgi:hypothetical protein
MAAGKKRAASSTAPWKWPEGVIISPIVAVVTPFDAAGAVDKAALAARLPGFPHAWRPPLVTATDAQCERIRSFLRREMLPLIYPGPAVPTTQR